MSLTRTEIDEMKTQIEKTVDKFLGYGEPSVVTMAVNCIVSGYDKRKTTDKLSALLDSRKASKLTDKIFNIYEDTKASIKRKSRSDDRDKDRDSRKKLKTDDSHNEKDKFPSDKLSPDKMNELMMNAHRQIEMRKRAFKQDDHYAPIQKTMPMLKNRDAAIGGLYKGGLLSRNDSDKARKIASLTAQIQSKISSMANLQPPDKPTPLILDESGRTVDITGKEVQLTQVVPTLKANIRAKKREEFKAQLQESKGPEELQETQFFDNRIGSKSAVRNKRALKFHEPGKFQQLAAKIRTKAQLEKLQIEISQIARKTGISSATKLALIAPKTEALNEDVPNVEWWDSVILKGNKYPENEQQLKEFINEPAITNLVEHPAQMKPPTEPLKPVYMPVFLTKKERKKLRRQNRREAWKEEQEKIRLGIEPPPEPKLRISNLMRVLGTEAVQDPTKIEAHVRQQMAKRLKAHEDANAARKLTDDQRREKKARKLQEDTSLGVNVAVFRIRDLVNNASKKFKVETNAKQLYLTGCVMLYRDCNVVVVEGGPKQLRKYKRLMLQRIKWEEDIVKDNDGNEVPNKCVLVWEGATKQRHFGEMKFKVCPIEKMAREHFRKHQVEHYWNRAYSEAVLDSTEDVKS